MQQSAAKRERAGRNLPAKLTFLVIPLLCAFSLRAQEIRPFLEVPDTASVYISWHSSQEGPVQVEYGASEALGSATAGTFTYIGTNCWHTVKLNQLQAATRYYYRCISGSDTSALFHFRTTPRPGTAGEHVRVIKVGDSQKNENGMSKRIADTIAFFLRREYGEDWMDSVSFVMHTGDIVQSGSDQDAYRREFFDAYAAITPYVPVMISIGNHESESVYFYRYMHYSDLINSQERYYTFRILNSRFIALNSNGVYNTFIQTSWLKRQLEAAQRDSTIDYVFVYNHQAGQAEVWPDGRSTYVRRRVLPLLSRYEKVMMIAWGHAHNYESGSWPGKEHDIITLISGGAGGSLDRYRDNKMMEDDRVDFMLDHYHFVLVDVNGDTKKVHFTAYSLGHSDRWRNLEAFDQLQYDPHQPPPAKPEGLAAETEAGTVLLKASAFVGRGVPMYAEYQIIRRQGHRREVVCDSLVSSKNFYCDSGAPDYEPVNRNAGVRLSELRLPVSRFALPGQYFFVVRYRDNNLKWSEWSSPIPVMDKH